MAKFVAAQAIEFDDVVKSLLVLGCGKSTAHSGGLLKLLYDPMETETEGGGGAHTGIYHRGIWYRRGPQHPPWHHQRPFGDVTRARGRPPPPPWRPTSGHSTTILTASPRSTHHSPTTHPARLIKGNRIKGLRLRLRILAPQPRPDQSSRIPSRVTIAFSYSARWAMKAE